MKSIRNVKSPHWLAVAGYRVQVSRAVHQLFRKRTLAEDHGRQSGLRSMTRGHWHSLPASGLAKEVRNRIEFPRTFLSPGSGRLPASKGPSPLAPGP